LVLEIGSCHLSSGIPMKKGLAYIFPFYLSFVLSCVHHDGQKCSKLKRGEFYYKSGKAFEGSSIVRNDSVQIVTDERTGERLKERIVWMDACTYTLYPFPDSKPGILHSELFPIKVTIVEVTDKYYTVHVISGDGKTDFYDTAWIVRIK